MMEWLSLGIAWAGPLAKPLELDRKLLKAGLPYLPEKYITAAMNSSIITFAIFFLLGGFVQSLAGTPVEILGRSFIMPEGPAPRLSWSLMFSLLGFVFAALVFSGFLIYPELRVGARKRSIERNLPYAVSYLAILAGAGVPPDRSFELLAKSEAYGEVCREAARIALDTKVMGVDILTALRRASERSPSERFSEVLQGIITTITSGGDLRAYLREVSEKLLREHRRIQRDFVDTLTIISEIYVTLFVAAPIFFMILFAIMGMIGGVGLPIGLKGLLQLITYIMLPLAYIAFLIFLDAISPEV